MDLTSFQEVVKKADTLIEALPYIRSFKDKIVVVKCGGNLITESNLVDIVFMETVGMRPVIVHGGKQAINRRIKEKGIEPKFVKGLRVTDQQVMKIAEDTLAREVGSWIVKIVAEHNGRAKAMSAKSIMKVRKHLPWVKGKQIDIGFVGDVVSVVPEPIISLCERGVIPVIAPIGSDEGGQSYNVNADTAAGEIAAGIKAEKLVFLTDVKGIMRDQQDPDSLFSTLKKGDLEAMIENRMITEGMVPKAKAALKASERGVHKTHIVDGRLPHSLLLEIFTDKGIGTQVIP